MLGLVTNVFCVDIPVRPSQPPRQPGYELWSCRRLGAPGTPAGEEGGVGGGGGAEVEVVAEVGIGAEVGVGAEVGIGAEVGVGA